jgi:hypothetical protein
VHGSNGRQRARNPSVDGHSERFVEIALDRGGIALGVDRDDLRSRRGGARAVMLADVFG